MCSFNSCRQVFQTCSAALHIATVTVSNDKLKKAVLPVTKPHLTLDCGDSEQDSEEDLEEMSLGLLLSFPGLALEGHSETYLANPSLPRIQLSGEKFGVMSGSRVGLLMLGLLVCVDDAFSWLCLGCGPQASPGVTSAEISLQKLKPSLLFVMSLRGALSALTAPGDLSDCVSVHLPALLSGAVIEPEALAAAAK